MPDSEKPVFYPGGSGEQGRKGRIEESSWLQKVLEMQGDLKGRVDKGLEELEAFEEKARREIKGAASSPENLRAYLEYINQYKNSIREELEDVWRALHEQLGSSDASDEPGLQSFTNSIRTGMEITFEKLNQEATEKLKTLTDEINTLIEATEREMKKAEEHAKEATNPDIKPVDVPTPPPPPPPPGHEDSVTQKFYPEDIARVREQVNPKMDMEVYEKAVLADAQELLQVLSAVKGAGSTEKLREGMREELERLRTHLKELDEQAGAPDSEIRRDAESIVGDIEGALALSSIGPSESPPPPPAPPSSTVEDRDFFVPESQEQSTQEQGTAHAARAEYRRGPKGSSFVAWMPRVPAPPYQRRVRPSATGLVSTVSAPAMPGVEQDRVVQLERQLKEQQSAIRRLNERIPGRGHRPPTFGVASFVERWNQTALSVDRRLDDVRFAECLAERAGHAAAPEEAGMDDLMGAAQAVLSDAGAFTSLSVRSRNKELKERRAILEALLL